jgi:hypothetical protein
MSAAKCETGWGDLSTRAVLDGERLSPHPAAHALRLCATTLPLQGRVAARHIGRTSTTSGTKCFSRFWMPCCKVAVDDGQPAHEPFMLR